MSIELLVEELDYYRQMGIPTPRCDQAMRTYTEMEGKGHPHELMVHLYCRSLVALEEDGLAWAAATRQITWADGSSIEESASGLRAKGIETFAAGLIAGEFIFADTYGTYGTN